MFYTHAQKQTNTTRSHSLAALAVFGPAPLWTISFSSFSPDRTTAASSSSFIFMLEQHNSFHATCTLCIMTLPQLIACPS